MQLLSAHAALGLLIAAVTILLLAAIGVPILVALIIGAVAGWLLVQTVLRDVADRAERWLTTMR